MQANQTIRIQPANPGLFARDTRVEAMKALVSKMAHDFNNTLAPMLGWFSLIKEEVEEDSPVAIYAEKGMEIARDSEKKLDEIMTLVKPQRKYHPVEFDFKKLIEKEVDNWRATVPPSVNLEINTTLEECKIVADPNHWENGIRHLLNNARYGLALGGKLKVILRKEVLTEEKAKDLGVGSLVTYLLEVKDNGLGMSPEVLERAFDPFFTTRPRNQFLGLGLTFLHSLARLQGGQIIIESELDKGTEVFIWLPQNPPPIEVKKESQANQLAQLSKQPLDDSKKILLVDDDPIVLEVLRGFLAKKTTNVIVAENGKRALDIYKRRSTEIQLIITDIRMPEMNGIEFVEVVKSLSPSVPVIFITGEKDHIIEESIKRLGDCIPPIIKKPCSFKEFIEVVDRLLNSGQNPG